MFNLNAKWPAAVKGVSSPVDMRLCKLRIDIGPDNVTAYLTDDAVQHDDIEIPAYYIAEWLAENWWALLWEPRKADEGGDDADFRHRHCLLAAQHGFALPNVTFTPTGDDLEIYASARRSDYAEVQFQRGGKGFLARNQAERHFTAFIENVIAHVGNIEVSPLCAAWQEIIKTTDDDEKFFCSLIGALGLSPYEEHRAIEQALDSASLILSKNQLRDLCVTSRPEEVVRAAFVACHAERAAQDGQLIDISMLQKVTIPSDIPETPAFNTGYRAARKLRAELSIGERDLDGARKVFDVIQLEKIKIAGMPSGEMPVYGAIKRNHDEGRVALMRGNAASIRFSSARATYLIWGSDRTDDRLITRAATRDQQASRAFAAELLMPHAYVKSLASGNRISCAEMAIVAEQNIIAYDTIKFQAQNAGLQIVR